MTLILELTSEETERLEELAQKQGEDIAQLVHDLLTAYLTTHSNVEAERVDAVSPIPAEDPVIRLMQKWIEEDTTDDPEEMQRRTAEWQTLKTNLEENRLSMPVQSSQATERPAPRFTPAQAIAYWQKEGLLGPWGGDQDSLELARELRKKAETRDHE